MTPIRARSLVAIAMLMSLLFPTPGRTHAPQARDAHEVELCAIEGFDDFLREFSRSINFQKNHTLFPLQKLHVDKTTDPEPLPTEQLLISSTEVIFPLFPTQKEIRSMNGDLSVIISHGKAEASIRKPDTDYLVKYFFEHNQCWGLYRIEDWSL